MKTETSNKSPTWFRMYATRIFAYPKLSAEEEKLLFKQWESSGDQGARNRIITSCLRYVIIIALQYRRMHFNVEDLIAEGNLGLMLAFSRYDSSRGIRFYTYASYWIRAFMLKLIMQGSRQYVTTSWPYRSSVFFKLQREKARCLSLYGDDEEAYVNLADRLQAPVEKVKNGIKIIESSDVSLDLPVNGLPDTTAKDQLPDRRPTPEDEAIRREREHAACRLVQNAVAALDGREKYIIERRFLDDSDASLSEIGRNLSLSRERARQLEWRAKVKIRESLARSGIRSFSMI